MPVVRRLALGALVATGGLVGLAVGVGWWLSEPGHEGEPGDHFDGRRFVNAEPTPLPTLGRALRLLREGRGPAWVDREVAPRPPPPPRVHDGALRATFVNHSTVLMQHDGTNVLTDPIWSQRCSAVQWAGPRRHHRPGVGRDQLPSIDVVLISHNHYDHLDVDTLRWLAERDDPVVVVPLGVGATVRRLGFSTVHELDWDQAVDAGPLRIVGQQVRHFSGRGLFDRNRSLWLGFVVQGPTRRWYFAGDTGDGPHFAATGAAHGPFDLALLPIGAYAPRWFMSPIHIGPDEAVAAHVALRAERSLGVHHGTFRLTSEPQDEPVQRLAEAVAEAGLEPWRFEALEPGRAMVLLPRG